MDNRVTDGLRYSLTIALLAATPCFADIVNCNGEWTNKSCDKQVIKAIPEKPLDARLADKNYPQKKQILSSVSAYTGELSNLGVTFPEQSIRDFCLKEETSVAECQKDFETVRTSFIPAVEAAKTRTAVEQSSSSVSAVKDSQDAVTAPADTSVTVIDNSYTGSDDHFIRHPHLPVRQNDGDKPNYHDKKEPRGELGREPGHDKHDTDSSSSSLPVLKPKPDGAQQGESEGFMPLWQNQTK